MLPDGSWHVSKAPANAVHAVQGSSRILKNGKSFTAESVKRDQLADSSWKGKNCRVAGEVTVDGRLVPAQRTLDKVYVDTREGIMLALGCPNAMGDGGGSAYLWPHDNGWGRKVDTSLCSKEGTAKKAQSVERVGQENNRLNSKYRSIN
jgi:hypothetical protein